MNPYEAPSSELDHDLARRRRTGRVVVCRHCGGNFAAIVAATTRAFRHSFSHGRTSSMCLYVVFFGWVILLIRGAFGRQKAVCRDCGKQTGFKTLGSWIALGILILLVFLGLVAIFEEEILLLIGEIPADRPESI